MLAFLPFGLWGGDRISLWNRSVRSFALLLFPHDGDRLSVDARGLIEPTRSSIARSRLPRLLWRRLSSSTDCRWIAWFSLLT